MKRDYLKDGSFVIKVKTKKPGGAGMKVYMQ